MSEGECCASWVPGHGCPTHGWLHPERACCGRWDPRYGCSEETCGGCFGDKPHDRGKLAACEYAGTFDGQMLRLRDAWRALAEHLGVRHPRGG